MQRQVSRGDFLKYIGVAFLGVIGVVGFLKNLHEIVPGKDNTSNQVSGGAGYGRSPYGR